LQMGQTHPCAIHKHIQSTLLIPYFFRVAAEGGFNIASAILPPGWTQKLPTQG